MTIQINRIAMGKCECHPGVRGGGASIHEQVRADEIAIRLEIERRHDTKTRIANGDRQSALRAVLRKYAARAAGRCHGCGERIGDVPVCPECNAPQASSSQRGK